MSVYFKYLDLNAAKNQWLMKWERIKHLHSKHINKRFQIPEKKPENNVATYHDELGFPNYGFFIYGGEIGLITNFSLDWLLEGWPIKPGLALPHEEMPRDEGGDQDEGQLVQETQTLLDQARGIADVEKPRQAKKLDLWHEFSILFSCTSSDQTSRVTS